MVRVCEAIGVTGITWIGNDSIVFGDAAGLKARRGSRRRARNLDDDGAR